MAGCTRSVDKSHPQPPIIATSIPAIASILHTVVAGGACRVDIQVLNTATVEHFFELTPQKKAVLKKAGLVVLAGGGLDVWLKDHNSNTVSFEQMGFLHLAGHDLNAQGKHVSVPHDEHGHEPAEPSGRGHTHEQDSHHTDPHVWLNPSSVYAIGQKLFPLIHEAFPQYCNRDMLVQNMSRFEKELSQMATRTQRVFSGKGVSKSIATHDAFHYFVEYLRDTGVVISYEAFEVHHAGSRLLSSVMTQLESDQTVAVWDTPPFSLCDKVEKKVGKTLSRCLRLDPSGHVFFHHQREGLPLDYVSFFTTFLSGFESR